MRERLLLQDPRNTNFANEERLLLQDPGNAKFEDTNFANAGKVSITRPRGTLISPIGEKHLTRPGLLDIKV
jgi:hypothetical protein